MTAAMSCGFPDHSFNDDEFYAKVDGSSPGGGAGTSGSGGRSGGGGGSGPGGRLVDAGAGGGSTAGGGGGAGGSDDGGGFAGGGSGGALVPVEGGRPREDGGGLDGASEGGDGSSADAGPVCGPGLDLCPPGICADFQNDDDHCGSCTIACPPGETCNAGNCESICAPGLDFCPPNSCVDFLADATNCGRCGTRCTGGEICRNGNCEPPCTAGLTQCNGNCVDLDTDENYCGGCTGSACSAGQVCEGGLCFTDCGALTRCGARPGVCVDVTTDDTRCGNCATNCRTMSPQRVCSNGTCLLSCGFPFIPCGNTCVNPSNDDLNCNGCNNICPTGQDCIGASCTDLVEDCQNGSDDDEDNLVDCADPECNAGFVCATSPAGWTGPIALWSGASGTAPNCSTAGGYPTAVLTANGGLVVPPYACPACNCGPSPTAYCDDLEFYYDSTTTCTSTTAWFPIIAPADGSCNDAAMTGSQGPRSSELIDPPSAYVHGSCVPNQAQPQFPSPTWSTDVRGCGSPPTAGGGCGTSGQCLRKPTAPFGADLCIYRTGTASCPADYPVRKPGAAQSYYQSLLEGRSCSSCTCGTPSCGGTVRTYTDLNCSQNPTVVLISGADTCTTIPADPTRGGGGFSNNTDTRSLQWENPGPVCGSATSTLSGAPTPDSPVTVCCQSP